MPAVLGTVLAGCADPAPDYSEDTEGSNPPSAATSTPRSPASTPPDTEHGRWGAYGSQEEACAGVVADVVRLSVLSSSLPVSQQVPDVQRVEDEVKAMLEAAPPALVSHYARIQLAVDSYGEELTIDDSPTADPVPTEESRFDDQALEEALEQIRAWLTDTCRDRR